MFVGGCVLAPQVLPGNLIEPRNLEISILRAQEDAAYKIIEYLIS
jgi:hypothetical protein